MIKNAPLNNELDIKELSELTNHEKVYLKTRFGKSVHSNRYITSNEFKKRAIEKVKKFCDTHGIL